jgi:hypothetical protein
MKKLIALFILSPLCFIINSHAQNPVSSLTVSAEYLSPDSSLFQLLPEERREMEERKINAYVNLSASEGVEKIALSLGSSEGSNDIFYKEFIYGDEGDFSDGTSCHSSGNGFSFCIGNYAGFSQYYVAVFTIMSDGSMSESIRYTLY